MKQAKFFFLSATLVFPVLASSTGNNMPELVVSQSNEELPKSESWDICMIKCPLCKSKAMSRATLKPNFAGIYTTSLACTECEQGLCTTTAGQSVDEARAHIILNFIDSYRSFAQVSNDDEALVYLEVLQSTLMR